jgi:hypothetical protein
MIRSMLDWLTGERGPLLLALLAVLISLPALRLGFQADDHILAMQVERGEPPWSLFRISETNVAEGRQTGAMAWWASPRLSGEFLRPLSSLELAALFTLWPSAPWLMLLINVLVYGACVWIAAQLYRKIAPSLGIAALAGLLFAIDDAHAHSVGWISGGNTIMALLFALAGLYFQIRARESGRLKHTLGSVLSVVLALGAGEAGTWVFAYLMAHAVVLDDRPVAARLRSLAPHIVVGAIWAAIYVRGHYGIHHVSWYLELSSPARVLAHGVLNLPLTVTSLLGPSMIAFSIFEPLWKARALLLPIALGLLWLAWPALWSSKASRFFGLVTALAALPSFLTVPQDRVLIGAGFGALGWIATAIAQSEAISGVSGISAARHKVARVVLRGCHIWMAAVLFIPMLAAQYGFEVGAQTLRAAAKPERTVVLINTPVELLAMYTAAMIDLEHDPARRPNAIHQLYAGGSELWVERTGVRAIELTATRGWGYVPVERIFCRPSDMPRAGDERRVRGMTVRTLEVNHQGMPQRVRFTFDAPLESGALQWLVWTDAGHPVPWQPPAIGQRARIAPLSLIEALP